MLKRIVLVLILTGFISPVFAEEINMTPHDAFSGIHNNSAHPAYPHLNKPLSASDIVEEEGINDIMAPKSVRQMGNITPSVDKQAPMTYSQFPQYMDSSNSMMMMQGIQGGMQNMFMGY